jgi:hypothetical protein
VIVRLRPLPPPRQKQTNPWDGLQKLSLVLGIVVAIHTLFGD